MAFAIGCPSALFVVGYGRVCGVRVKEAMSARQHRPPRARKTRNPLPDARRGVLAQTNAGVDETDVRAGGRPTLVEG